MKLFKKHKERVEKVRDFTGKNMIFVIMAVIALVLLSCNFLIKPETPQTENQAVIIEETIADDELLAFRFYFIDLVILAGGGGVCLVMILRERKKTKEDLK